MSIYTTGKLDMVKLQFSQGLKFLQNKEFVCIHLKYCLFNSGTNLSETNLASNSGGHCIWKKQQIQMIKTSKFLHIQMCCRITGTLN